MNSEHIYIDGIKYCVHMGMKLDPRKKISIFALHGFSGSGLDFAPLAEELSKYNWYAPDFLGHGQSEILKEEGFYSLENTLNYLKHIIEKFNLKKSILLGYSMGGRIALHLVKHYPKMFQSVILIGASPGLENADERRKQDNDLACEILKNGIDHFNEQWLKNPLIKTQNNILAQIREPMLLRRQKNSAIGLANTLRKLGTGALPSLWNDLKSIKLPVYLTTGENDEKFSIIANEMEAQLANSKKIVIPKSGHAAHLENMSYFISLMENL